MMSSTQYTGRSPIAKCILWNGWLCCNLPSLQILGSNCSFCAAIKPSPIHVMSVSPSEKIGVAGHVLLPLTRPIKHIATKHTLHWKSACNHCPDLSFPLICHWCWARKVWLPQKPKVNAARSTSAIHNANHLYRLSCALSFICVNIYIVLGFAAWLVIFDKQTKRQHEAVIFMIV